MRERSETATNRENVANLATEETDNLINRQQRLRQDPEPQLKYKVNKVAGQLLKLLLLLTTVLLSVFITLFVSQKYSHQREYELYVKYSNMNKEYIDSFNNQLKHHQDKIKTLEDDKIGAQKVILELRDMYSKVETSYQVMRTRTDILESLIKALKYPSIIIKNGKAEIGHGDLKEQQDLGKNQDN